MIGRFLCEIDTHSRCGQTKREGLEDLGFSVAFTVHLSYLTGDCKRYMHNSFSSQSLFNCICRKRKGMRFASLLIYIMQISIFHFLFRDVPLTDFLFYLFAIVLPGKGFFLPSILTAVDSFAAQLLFPVLCDPSARIGIGGKWFVKGFTGQSGGESSIYFPTQRQSKVLSALRTGFAVSGIPLALALCVFGKYFSFLFANILSLSLSLNGKWIICIIFAYRCMMCSRNSGVHFLAACSCLALTRYPPAEWVMAFFWVGRKREQNVNDLFSVHSILIVRRLPFPMETEKLSL